MPSKEVSAREFFSAAIHDYKATLEANAKLRRVLETIHRIALTTGTPEGDRAGLDTIARFAAKALGVE